MVDSFLSYLEFEKRCSPHTLKAYRADLYACQSHIAASGIAHLGLATHAAIRSWILELSQSGHNPASVARKMASLRSLYKFLLRQGQIKESPMDNIKTPRLRKRTPAFVPEAAMEQLSITPDYPEGFTGL
ncbi:MAG: site-specific integrase, partial [Bacteroidota bacterium]